MERRIRILRPCRQWRVGQTVTAIDSAAEELVQAGYAAYADDVPESMAVEPERNAMLQPPQRKRRRPRKVRTG